MAVTTACINTSTVQFQSDGFTIKAFLARPDAYSAADAKLTWDLTLQFFSEQLGR